MFRFYFYPKAINTDKKTSISFLASISDYVLLIKDELFWNFVELSATAPIMGIRKIHKMV